MVAVREPPKKRTKTTKTAELSIVPCDDGAPTRMCFPPSKSLETTTKKNGKHVNSSAGASKSKNLGKGAKSESVRSKRSKTGSNQPKPISIKFPMPRDETNVPVKVRGKSKKKECAEKTLMVPQDSPAMCTRSKMFNPASPSMSTRSKRRLSL